jgi:hypothetical protein
MSVAQNSVGKQGEDIHTVVIPGCTAGPLMTTVWATTCSPPTPL